MKCPRKEQLARYLDGELPEKSKLKTQEHLLSCPECRGLLKSMRQADSILRGYLPPHLAPQPGCPNEETILAYAEGGLADRDERRRITAHLAGCDYCAVRAAGALETIRLRDELAEKGMEPVPSNLARRVRKSFGRAKPISLGRVVTILADLRERFQRSFEYGFPAPAFSAVMEPAAPYETGQNRAENDPPLDNEVPGGKPLTGRVIIEIGPSGEGKADLRVSLRDEHDRPRSGIDLRLQKGEITLQTRKTGPRGEAGFPGIETGRYRLLISPPGKAFLDITII